jgi:hypothetical protein
VPRRYIKQLAGYAANPTLQSFEPDKEKPPFYYGGIKAQNRK